MSRHRAVRNLDLTEELADDYDHDADFLDDISPEDQDALEQALLAVIDTLGEPEECGISERRMKEALWETYFDAPAAVDMLMEAKEQEEAQARKRADGFTNVGTSAKAPRLQHIPPRRATAHRPPVSDTRASAPRDSPLASPVKAAGASPVSSPRTASPASGSASKKLSKLQQKLQANREKLGAAASGTSASKGIARLLSPRPSTQTPPRVSSPMPTAEPVTVAPSGTQLSTLFPRTHPQQPLSSFGRALSSVACGHAASTHISLSSRTDAEIEQLQAVFSQLSPDDVVQQARQGTRLAR
ncbi:Hypothetical protein MSYG_3729 [Malassezia sympodialis ATCC 42132]|uniref:HBS1-like protein N-terminal domain-containing protein n=1 Tax=Malassezia sympodialis (strain ATCC 42132) TaxID=1230383 RepID=A0A1M8AAB5_MALS4|nr:Hypothetical protein MSYG_3729 [Malassezia sympodialis ATCC 42132]